MSLGGIGWASTWGTFRDRLAFLLGVSHDGRRDLYMQFGWPKLVLVEQLVALYRRNAIANRIIRAFPQDTWRDCPLVRDEAGDSGERGDKTYSPFVEAVEKFFEKWRVTHRLERVDRTASLGEFGVLLLGFQDGKQLTEPLQKGNAPLLYIQPYAQINCTIGRYNNDPVDPRFGLPEIYTLKTGNPVSGENVAQKRSITAHWTRVIHIAESLEEDDVFGVPRLLPVFNHLLDLEKVLGSSAETFWLNARPGLSLEADPEFSFSEEQLAEYKKQAEEYEHQLRRILALQGVKATNLSAAIADPSTNVESLLKMISGSTGIPERILVGSERGELGGDNDETNWNQRIDQRRNNFATPVILKPFIQRMIDTQNIPIPNGHFWVEWPGNAMSDEKIAQIGLQKTQALAAYVAAPGAEFVVPFTEFRKELLGLPPQPPEDAANNEVDDLLARAQGVSPDQLDQKDAASKMALLAPPSGPGGAGKGPLGKSSPPSGKPGGPPSAPKIALPKANVEAPDITLTLDDLVIMLRMLALQHPDYAARITAVIDAMGEPIHANYNPNHGSDGRFTDGSGVPAALGMGAGILGGKALGERVGQALGMRYTLTTRKLKALFGVFLPKSIAEKLTEKLVVIGAATVGGVYAGSHLPLPGVVGSAYVVSEWAARMLHKVPGGSALVGGIVDSAMWVLNKWSYTSKHYGGGQLGRSVGGPIGMAIGAVVGAISVEKAVHAFERAIGSRPKANFNPNHDPDNGEFTDGPGGSTAPSGASGEPTPARQVINGLGGLAVSLTAGQVGATAAAKTAAGAAARTIGAEIGAEWGGITGGALGGLGSMLAGGPVGSALFGAWGATAGTLLGSTIGGAIGAFIGGSIPFIAGSILGSMAGDAAASVALGVKPINEAIHKVGDVIEHGVHKAGDALHHAHQLHAFIENNDWMFDLGQIMKAAAARDEPRLIDELTKFKEKYQNDPSVLVTLQEALKEGNGS